MFPEASSFLDAPGWLLMLVDSVTRVSLVLFAAGIAALVLQRAAANVRHFVWHLAIVGSLIIPLATVVLPRIEWKVLPARVAPSGPSNFELPARHPQTSRTQWAAWDSDQRPELVVPTAWTRAPEGDALPRTTTPSSSWGLLPRLKIEHWLMLVWLAGVLVVLEYAFVDRIRVFFLAQRSRDVNDERRQVFVRQVARLGVPGGVRLVEADIELPMTWGVVSPVVALPLTSVDWPEERLEAVLLHELAHVRRRDTLTQLLAQLSCALYWFNPMVWFAARQLRVLREYACDDEVITHGVRPSSYAEELLQLIENVKRRDALSGATLGMARRSQFKERLFAMLDPAVRRARLPKQRAWSMALIALVVTGSVVMVQPAAAEPKPSSAQLPRLTPKQSAQRQVPSAPAPVVAVPTPVLPRNTTPVADEVAELDDVEEVAELDDVGSDDEAAVRAKVKAAVANSKDDASLAFALKRIAHDEELNEEATRQAYLAATTRLNDDAARWVALEALLVGAPISVPTGEGIMREARKFTRDAERVEFLARMHRIRESDLVRGPLASEYLDLAQKLQSQEALSDALRRLLHPSPVASASLERAMGLAASLDADLLVPVLVEVTDHQEFNGNVPTLYGALIAKLDGKTKADAIERYEDAAGSSKRSWKRIAMNVNLKDVLKQSRDDVKRAFEDQRRAAEDQRRAAEEQRRAADDERRAADDQRRAGEEQRRELDQLRRNKERLQEKAERLKEEALKLDAQMRALEESLDE